MHAKTPLVIATLHPTDIMDVYLGADKKEIIKHLAIYRKKNIGWDEYRKNVPDDILIKWQKVLDACRSQGFVNPVSNSEEVFWSVMIGDSKYTDPCSVCSKNIFSGNCEGRRVENDKGNIFMPCWKKTG